MTILLSIWNAFSSDSAPEAGSGEDGDAAVAHRGSMAGARYNPFATEGDTVI